MIGKYRVYVNVGAYREPILFYMDIKRKITLICGNSAIGKTTICKAINNLKSRIFVKSFSAESDKPDKVAPIKVLSPSTNDAIDVIQNHENSIFVLDEDVFYPAKNRELLLSLIDNSNNYFIIIARNLKFRGYMELRYSVKEIYEIVKNNSNVSDTAIYSLKVMEKFLYKLTEFFTFTKFKSIHPEEVVLVEDTGSGLEFYTNLFPNNKVYTVNGKSNFSQFLLGRFNATDVYGNIYTVNNVDSLVLVPDGAAFGCDLHELLQIIYVLKTSIRVLLPESFEHILLLSINNRNYNDRIQHPYNYLDVKTNNKSGSWEVYYTDLLKEYGNQVSKPYSKSSITGFYLSFISNAIGIINDLDCIESNSIRSNRKYFTENKYNWS